MKKSINDLLPSIKTLIDFNFSILGVYHYSKEVHVDNNCFLKLFNNYKATDRNSYDYPIELSETIDGIRFFSIFQIGDFYEAK